MRQVTYEEGKQLMLLSHLNLFFETSAKNGDNVDNAFNECAKLIFLNCMNEGSSPPSQLKYETGLDDENPQEDRISQAAAPHTKRKSFARGSKPPVLKPEGSKCCI